ncbi:MAG: secretin N-terminal domain-containing protein [Phycisphaerales bacterium]|nr:secretin N-terminal domain-containing protein [Phycisphaerales bacterium]
MQVRSNATLSTDARPTRRFRWMKGPSFAVAIAFAGVSLASALPLDGGDRPERVGPASQPTGTQEAATEQEAPRRDGPANAPDAEVENTPERTGPAVAATPQNSTDRGTDLSGTRRTVDDEPVPLNFDGVTVQDVLPYIVDWTGKAVMPKSTMLTTTKITLFSDRPLAKHAALDLIFQAFRLNGIGVVETPDLIMLNTIMELNNFQPNVVLGPEVDVTSMSEDGSLVTKVFRLEYAKVGDLESQLSEGAPEYGNLTVDVNSNQIILEGDIGWAKRVQKLIDLLDVAPFLAVKTETFRLAYADAQTVADIVLELFSPNPNSSSRTQSRAPTSRNQRGSQNSQQELPQVGTSDQLQVSVLPQTNAVTVRAEPEILTDIRYLIETAWDIPPSREGNIFRLYDLRYTDPVKVKTLLVALLEEGGGSSAPAGRGGGGGSAGADAAVADIFRIEAYPDSNRLIVISKTPDNFDWLDSMIDEIDQPLSVGMPVNVELKHASAIEVADILNALLGAAGGGGRGIQAPDEGLTGINFESAGGGTDGGTAAAGDEITFPWQSGRGANGEEAAEVSALVGKSRVVPNPGQNSLLVLATPEIQDALLKIIEDLDRPGRQVMITATLAEVTLGDALNLGIRVGSGIQASGDNSIGGTVGLDLTKGSTELQNSDGDATPSNPQGGNFASPWFDTSFLEVGTSVNFVLSALSEQNNVRILQRPRVFTSDNKEAKFFAGSDVTFQTGSTANDSGTTTSFEQEAIGIGLNVRPRITTERNVAMEIEILLSNLSSQLINDNPVVNRRQTTTTVTVKNNQTIVLSGIRREDDTDVERKIPLLGDIPLLGPIFTSTEKGKSLVELVIFITPIVVDNPDENDTNFNVEERKRLDELSKPLEEMVKELGGDEFFDQIDDDTTSPEAGKTDEPATSGE